MPVYILQPSEVINIEKEKGFQAQGENALWRKLYHL